MRWIVIAGLGLSACSPTADPVVETISVATTIEPVETTTTTGKAPTTASVAGAPNSSIADITPIRSITPEEWPQIMGMCMRERGIDVVIRADGGLITQGLPAEQQERLSEVQAECKALYPVDDSYRGLLDVEELTRLYDYYTDPLIPCLEDEGYSGFAPPSLETYVDSYATETEWMPYTDIIEIVDLLTEGERLQLFENCPQAPSLDYLFGE